jgi:hypothetical protein
MRAAFSRSYGTILCRDALAAPRASDEIHSERGDKYARDKHEFTTADDTYGEHRHAKAEDLPLPFVKTDLSVCVGVNHGCPTTPPPEPVFI